MSNQSRHSVRAVRTNRSANAFARGARTGVLMTRAPIDLITSSKGATNFESRSRIRNLKTRPSSSSLAARFLACWVTHVPIGDTELGALADDAEIAPGRILPRQAQDESDDVGRKRVVSTLLAVRVGPVPRQELPVPVHERRWRHEENRPTLTREQSCERGEHSTIGGG